MNRYEFPEPIVPKEEKERERWYLEWLMAIFYNGSRGRGDYISKYAENRAYAKGIQSAAEFVEYFGLLKDDSGHDYTHLNIDWTIPAVYVKQFEIAHANIDRRSWNIEVTAIDPVSEEKKRTDLNKVYAKMRDSETLARWDSMLGLKSPNNHNDPKNEDEFKIYSDFMYKFPLESNMENLITLVFQTNRFEKIRSQLIWELIYNGTAAVIDYPNSAGIPELSFVKPENMLTDSSDDEEFSDARYAGRLIWMTDTSLKALAGDQFSDEEYKEIRKSRGSLAYSDGGYTWNTYNIDTDSRYLVVQGWWYVTHHLDHEITDTKYGTKKSRRVSRKIHNEGAEYLRKNIQVIHEGYWIVGTEKTFSCDQHNDTRLFGAQDQMLDKPELPLTAIKMYSDGLSMTEKAKPFIKPLCIAWFRWQDAILKFQPRVRAIDLDAIQGVNVGAKGIKDGDITIQQDQTGNYYYRSRDPHDPSGYRMNVIPVSGINNDDIQRLEQIRIQFNAQIENIQAATGHNPYTDASQPPNDTVVAAMEQAVISSNNALYPIAYAVKTITERVARKVGDRIQVAAKYGRKIRGYIQTVGDSGWKIVELNSDIPLADFGYRISDMLSDDKQKLIYQWVGEQLKIRSESGQGGIDLEAATVAIRCTNWKQMIQELIIRKRMIERKDQEREMARMDKDNEKITLAAQEKQKADQAAFEMEMQKTQTIEDMKLKTAIAIEEEKRKTVMLQLKAKSEDVDEVNMTEEQKIKIQGEEQRKLEILKAEKAKELERVKGDEKVKVEKAKPKPTVVAK